MDFLTFMSLKAGIFYEYFWFGLWLFCNIMHIMLNIFILKFLALTILSIQLAR